MAEHGGSLRRQSHALLSTHSAFCASRVAISSMSGSLSLAPAPVLHTTASCPHAPDTSCPFSCRTVHGMPCCVCTMSWNAFTYTAPPGVSAASGRVLALLSLAAWNWAFSSLELAGAPVPKAKSHRSVLQ